MKRFVEFTLILTMFLASNDAKAQRDYGFCIGQGNSGSVLYFSSVFPVSDISHFDQPGHGDGEVGQVFWDTGNEIAKSFRQYLTENEGAVPTVCHIYESLSAANEGVSNWKKVFRSSATSRIRDVSWVYISLRRGTHIGNAKPTEAEALYDAENWPGPFEDNQYKTIHSWDSHDCTTKQVTGIAGSSEPTTFYQCTVTFSYSDTASPVAKATFGKGDTQDAAIAAAKSSPNKVLLTGITWGQPLCSSFSTTVKNPYKADYGHSAGTKKENWACEIDFTGNK